VKSRPQPTKKAALGGSRQAATDPRSGRRFELVLGGGGVLGAFQAGLYEALEESRREPDRLVGTSIGAVNAALIAGNPPERRLERLRAFWDLVSEPALSPAALSGDARRMAKAGFALQARLLGRQGLYRPHLPRLFLQSPAWGSPSLYHLGAAFATLRRLVDFDRIGNGGPRLAVNLTDLETGAPVLVDSAADRLRPEHLVASMGLLPDLPPTQIDGRWFCDGGFSANLPLHAVLDSPPEADVLCLAVDLLGDPGPPVFSLDGMMERSNDLLFANQTRSSLATLEARYAARDRGSVLLLLLACNGEGERVSQKIWDYGRRSLGERWRAGYEACVAALARLRDLPPPAPGRLQVHRLVVPNALPG
jgi:NTE family protein